MDMPDAPDALAEHEIRLIAVSDSRARGQPAPPGQVALHDPSGFTVPQHPESRRIMSQSFMITADALCRGLHPKSETDDMAIMEPRQLIVVWTAQL